MNTQDCQLLPKGTVLHTVAFSLVHPKGSPAEAAFLADSLEILGALHGVRDFTVCRQTSPKCKFEFALAMRFDSPSAFAAYNKNPVHCRYVEERWKKEVADFQETDFEAL